jgi:two-component system cell cycle sensor histidine kinase/response regulator CckA
MPTPTPSTADRFAAIEALDELIITVDSGLRIASVNQAVVKLLGVQAQALTGSPILQLVAPAARMDFGHSLDRALRGEPVARQQTSLVRNDGDEIPVSIAMGPIAGSGGAILLGSDMIEEQKLQNRLLHSKRMESTGMLAGGMAHEFNNILTAILALADFTARALPVDSSARADLEELRQQALKGSKLVRHLLAFSRRQLLRTEVVHLGGIFTELEPLLQRLVSERILISTNTSGDTKPVDVDRGLMELVLLELVSNASDAMEEGGTLSIDINPVSVDNHPTLRAGEYVEIVVQDSGLGFEPGVEQRMTEPFFSTKGGDHAGLGLSMVESVIQQHGGFLSLRSNVGAGTSVHILLPAARAAVPQAALTVDTGAVANETVLVVEDEQAVRTIICRSLRHRGYHVLEAKNGEDALLVAEKHNAPIHLVVTDVVMPEMSGPDLYYHLRRWYPTMRILFISGYAKGSIPPEALEDGSKAAFLAKPFTLDQLLSEVQRMIQRPRETAA